MLRVENSLGPFFSLSKSMASRAGNNVDWVWDNWWRAEEVVDKPFRHRSVS